MLYRLRSMARDRQARRLLVAALTVSGLSGFLLLTPRQRERQELVTAQLSELAPASSFPGAKQDIPVQPSPAEQGDAATLGLQELQKVREAGDLTAYSRADVAFTRALKEDPNRFEAVFGKAMLLLGLHQFVEGLGWVERALAMNPASAPAHGLLVDAQVELGRYDEAVTSAQRMVDLRPDQGSYSRISYLRELHGDVPGALDAMQRAVASGRPDTEGSLWAMHQLAQLHLRQHQLEASEATCRRALAAKANFAYARAGLAEINAARGESAAAIEQLDAVVAKAAVPDFLIALGELYEAVGRPDKATPHFEAAREILHLDRKVGSDVELILAVFELEYGDSRLAEGDVEAYRRAYERAPNVMAADQLAWLLFHAGEVDEAWHYSELARRLGTPSALFHYHAGVIAESRGEAVAARDHLAQALAISPSFSIRNAPRARALLGELDARLANSSPPSGG